MIQSRTITNNTKYLLALLSAGLIAAFFIPWVSWEEVSISGADMPLGHFFSISEKNFRLANPFPQFEFAYYILWLIPVLAGIILILILFNKKSDFVLVIVGILTLCVATSYILFSNLLSDLGVKFSLRIGIYLAVVSAIGIILLSSLRWIIKAGMVLAGPLLVWVVFYSVSNYLENEEFGDTADIKAAYSVNAMDFIREFEDNDSLANKKYMEKIIALNGRISSIERPNDSTINVKFSDDTGSYAIFPFEGQSVSEVEKLNVGDSISVKGSCSGMVYSEILGAYFISFKRSVLNK